MAALAVAVAPPGEEVSRPKPLAVATAPALPSPRPSPSPPTSASARPGASRTDDPQRSPARRAERRRPEPRVARSLDGVAADAAGAPLDHRALRLAVGATSLQAVTDGDGRFSFDSSALPPHIDVAFLREAGDATTRGCELRALGNAAVENHLGMVALAAPGIHATGLLRTPRDVDPARVQWSCPPGFAVQKLAEGRFRVVGLAVHDAVRLRVDHPRCAQTTVTIIRGGDHDVTLAAACTLVATLDGAHANAVPLLSTGAHTTGPQTVVANPDGSRRCVFRGLGAGVGELSLFDPGTWQRTGSPRRVRLDQAVVDLRIGTDS